MLVPGRRPQAARLRRPGWTLNVAKGEDRWPQDLVRYGCHKIQPASASAHLLGPES